MERQRELERQKELERQRELERQQKLAPIIQRANAGDIPAILELKKLAEEALAEVQAALEKAVEKTKNDVNNEKAKNDVNHLETAYKMMKALKSDAAQLGEKIKEVNDIRVDMALAASSREEAAEALRQLSIFSEEEIEKILDDNY